MILLWSIGPALGESFIRGDPGNLVLGLGAVSERLGIFNLKTW